MKVSELIRENTENLIDTMKKAEAASYRNTFCEYRVYIDSEGECGCEEWVAGDLGWFEFTDPDYYRYYIHTFSNQYYDIVRDWWLADDGEPDEDDDELEEDDDELEEDDREAIMEEAIEAAINSSEALGVYEEIIEYAIIDAIEAEREAEYSE